MLVYGLACNPKVARRELSDISGMGMDMSNDKSSYLLTA